MILKRFPWLRPLGTLLATLGFMFLAAKPLLAGPTAEEIYAQRAVADYQQTKTQFKSATNNSPAAWIFARACYNLADYATNDQSRATVAHEGINACRVLIADQPKSGPGHYYLGMNEGQLARTELVGALFLVRDMEREFKLAWTLDKHVDHGGPARSLGLLYRDAPGWPTSIGNRRKAQEWLEQSEVLEPAFPENPMILCESYLKWANFRDARRTWQTLLVIWPHAKTNYAGIAWEHDWADWSARRTNVQIQLDEHDADASPAKKTR